MIEIRGRGWVGEETLKEPLVCERNSTFSL